MEKPPTNLTASGGDEDGWIGTTRSRRLIRLALRVNAVLFVSALVVFLRSDSQLVLAQGADSLFDVFAGIILTISVSVGLKPSDEDHPFGHQRAEPIVLLPHVHGSRPSSPARRP